MQTILSTLMLKSRYLKEGGYKTLERIKTTKLGHFENMHLKLILLTNPFQITPEGKKINLILSSGFTLVHKNIVR